MFGKFTKYLTQIFGNIAEYSVKLLKIRQLTNIPFITETHIFYRNSFGRIFGQVSAQIFGPKPVSVTHWLVLILMVVKRVRSQCFQAEIGRASFGWESYETAGCQWSKAWSKLKFFVGLTYSLCY